MPFKTKRFVSLTKSNNEANKIGATTDFLHKTGEKQATPVTSTPLSKIPARDVQNCRSRQIEL
jgi:hypothetical protein